MGFTATGLPFPSSATRKEIIKQYKKEGLKEIPNTIEVKFDQNEFDLETGQKVYLDFLISK